MRREHEIKCLAGYFDAIEAGIKPFEVRRDDRGYKRGDILVLRRYRIDEEDTLRPDNQQPVQLRKLITYVLPGGQFGIEPGYVVLGLADLDPERQGG